MWWTFLMRRKNPRGCHLWGFLVRYGEPLRIGCCCLFISVQPFAYVAANYTCYNRDKKCGEQFGHGRTPPFCWRFGSVYSISHFILIFYNFLLMKTMINIKKEAVWKFHTASWPVRESNPGLRRERASSWPLDHQALCCFVLSVCHWLVYDSTTGWFCQIFFEKSWKFFWVNFWALILACFGDFIHGSIFHW